MTTAERLARIEDGAPWEIDKPARGVHACDTSRASWLIIDLERVDVGEVTQHLTAAGALGVLMLQEPIEEWTGPRTGLIVSLLDRRTSHVQIVHASWRSVVNRSRAMGVAMGLYAVLSRPVRRRRRRRRDGETVH